MIRDNRYAKYLLVLTPWILGSTFLISSWKQYSEAGQREHTAKGTIVSHEPSNHNRYGYRFEVDGRTYEGSQIPLRNEPTLGQSVVVYYDSADPTRSALTPLRNVGDSLLGPALAILVLSGIIALLVLLVGPALSRARDRVPPSVPPH